MIDVEKVSQCLESVEIPDLDFYKGDYETTYVIAHTTEESAYPFYLKNVVGVDYDVSGELSKIILKSDPGTAVLEIDIAQNKYDLSYIFISHNIKVIELVSDYIIIMKKGEIVEEGETNIVFKNPQKAYTKEMLSSVV